MAQLVNLIAKGLEGAFNLTSILLLLHVADRAFCIRDRRKEKFSVIANNLLVKIGTTPYLHQLRTRLLAL